MFSFCIDVVYLVLFHLHLVLELEVQLLDASSEVSTRVIVQTVGFLDCDTM